MEKLSLLGAVAVLFLVLTPTAHAQMVGDDGTVYVLQGISDGCGDTMSADECMASGGSSSTICKKTYCPACGMNQTQTGSVCYTLQGNFGYCSCQPGSVTTDRYGNKWPNCNASGSCTPPR